MGRHESAELVIFCHLYHLIPFQVQFVICHPTEELKGKLCLGHATSPYETDLYLKFTLGLNIVENILDNVNKQLKKLNKRF